MKNDKISAFISVGVVAVLTVAATGFLIFKNENERDRIKNNPVLSKIVVVDNSVGFTKKELPHKKESYSSNELKNELDSIMNNMWEKLGNNSVFSKKVTGLNIK